MGDQLQAVFTSGGKTIARARAAPPPIGGPITVNGELISAVAIRAETQHHNAPKGKPAVAWTKAARALAIRTLLLQEARRRGMDAEPVQVGPGRFETDEQALIAQLLDAATDFALPTEADARAQWARDPSRFRSPPLWEVSHILCACDPRDNAGRAKALARATTLTQLALDSPRNFSDLARRESDCGSRANGGVLGQLGPGDSVPEFEAALLGMREADITSEPVLSRHGYHVIRLDAVAEGRALPFEAVRRSILDALEKKAWSQAAADLVNRLIASAEISGVTMQPN